MNRLLILLVALLAFLPAAVRAEPADIDAAARGVVRVLIVERDGEEVYPVSHGTGFAVSRNRIVTNYHVIDATRTEAGYSILIVPPEGGEPTPARVVGFSPRNDLALVELEGDLRLPPLTIAGAAEPESGSAFAVGYPQSVDIAQGLRMDDVFRAQPPVKSQGFVSGRRPARQFDTILHTAPIARGNSGGPLLDSCGRVVGVNSFGTIGGEADAEFFFAVSMRELLPFLRANDVQPRVNAMPCRSLAELDEAERERMEMEAEAARRAEAETAATRAEAQRAAERQAERAILEERDNKAAIAAILLALALAAGFYAWQAQQGDKQTHFKVATALALIALIAAVATWFSRPSLSDIEDRAAQILSGEEEGETDGGDPQAMLSGELVCIVDPSRSRIVSASTDDLPFEWDQDGCVNGRTQYGLSNGRWFRVFVPNEEAVVSINRFDPATREYRMERYLLGANAMAEARAARATYSAPSCGAGDGAALDLGQQQETILALLPDAPNERVVYRCSQDIAADE